MTSLIRSPAHRALLFIVIATLAAFEMRHDNLMGIAIGASTLAIAYLKGRLIVLDFMEMRRAPLIWRGLFEAWLVVVAAGLLTAYSLGQSN